MPLKTLGPIGPRAVEERVNKYFFSSKALHCRNVKDIKTKRTKPSNSANVLYHFEKNLAYSRNCKDQNEGNTANSTPQKI